jgi:hypothetical protein
MPGVDPLDLVETVGESFFVLDPDLNVRFANRSFHQTFAVASEDTGRRHSSKSPAEFVDVRHESFTSDKQRPCHVSSMTALLAAARPSGRAATKAPL